MRGDDRDWLADLGPRQRAGYERMLPEYRPVYEAARRAGKTHNEATKLANEAHHEDHRDDPE